MFLGIFNHTRDAKGRVFIPARYREALGEEFVLFKPYDKCIWIYDMDAFTKIVEQVQQKSRTYEEREKQRNFFDSAAPVTMDKQGRFTIPQDFAQHAGLESEIVIRGAGSRMEIWSKEAYDARPSRSRPLTESDYPDVTY